MSKLRPIVTAAVAFVGSHKSEIGTLAAFLSASVLPGPWGVALHVVGYALAFVAGSKV